MYFKKPTLICRQIQQDSQALWSWTSQSFILDAFVKFCSHNAEKMHYRKMKIQRKGKKDS